MREILFRGKRIDNGEWVDGCYMTDEQDLSKAYIGHIFGTDGDGMFIHDMDIVMVVPETVCQYTGLTGKDGRKIFENDIVRLPKCENDIAVFTLRGCNYFLKGKRSNYELGSCDSECFEVISNIFDNPELVRNDA